MFRKIAAALLTVSLFTSCGGGGGGGGSSSGGGNDGVRFTPDRTSVSLSYDEGTSFMPTVEVNVTATGTFSGTLYIGAVVEGQGINPEIPAFVSQTSALFVLQARSGLAAGTYTGRVKLMGCSDLNCNKQIGNSPIYVGYTLVVRQTLAVTPGQINVASTSGSATSQTVTVRLPTGATSFTVLPNSGEPWLSYDQVTATTFRLNMRSLPPGTYSGAVIVAAGSSSVGVGVNYTVAGGVPYSAMSVSPNDLTLSGSEGEVIAPVALTVTPPSWDPTTSVRFVTPYTTNPVPWLSAAPVAGGYSIVADATDLSAGTYNVWALVNGAYPAQEVVVPIALTIGVGLVLPADQLVVISAESTSASLSGTVPINVVSGPSVGWTAQSVAPWLTLTDGSGMTGETLAFRVDPDQLASLPNDGTEILGGITVTPNRPNMSPRTFAVRVRKSIATVTNVGPYLQPAGRSSRVILRGRGFNAVGDLRNRLQFNANKNLITQITRVNDTELVLSLSPLSPLTYTFGFNNALGVQTTSASLKVVSPQTFQPVARPTGGSPRAIFYDAERSSVFLVNTELESLQRYRFGNQWDLSSIAMPAMVGAGLSQDGSRLLVATSTTTQGRIRQFNPADLNNQIASTDLEQPIAVGYATFQTTNDGRTWFGLGSGWNQMAYFDVRTGSVTTLDPAGVQFPRFYYGPSFLVSRDGERLIIDNSQSGQEGTLYMDAADSIVKENPANLRVNYRLSLSDDGSRFMHTNSEVRDRDFNLIGRIPGPLPYASGDIQHSILASLLSPDGTRVYAFAVRSDFPWQDTPDRLYVFDSTTRQQTTDDLPLLGYLPLAGRAMCGNPSDCEYVVNMTVSPDGNTVFVAGDTNLVVVPVGNAVLTPVPTAPPAAPQKAGRGAFVPWHLELQ